MIEVTRGDILKADAEALVNTVNCVGVMGRGIAAQFKRAYPKNFNAYQQACTRHEVQPGRMLIVETGQLANPRWVFNFPTKRHWRGNSRIEDIDAGLAALVADIRRLGIKSIAVPPLGCGLGGLDWAAVRPRIEHAFAALSDVTVLLFEPDGAPVPNDMVRSTNVPTMTPGRAVLVGLIERYLAGLMDPFVSLLEIHKLMYFMQEAGEPLRLRYTKALYGPYAENLRQVLAHVEGHFLTGYADGGDAPDKQLELVLGASKAALAFLEGHPDTKARFDRVAKLVQGFETRSAWSYSPPCTGWRFMTEPARSTTQSALSTSGTNVSASSSRVRSDSRGTSSTRVAGFAPSLLRRASGSEAAFAPSSSRVTCSFRPFSNRMEDLMQCPTCKKDMLLPWKGMITRMGVDFEATGRQCGSCGETIFEGNEVQRQEREIATALVARGVQTAAEFKFVRKMAGFRANEIAELLGVRPETVSRWERGEAEIPRSAAFALGELFNRPRVTREKLEAFAR